MCLGGGERVGLTYFPIGSARSLLRPSTIFLEPPKIFGGPSVRISRYGKIHPFDPYPPAQTDFKFSYWRSPLTKKKSVYSQFNQLQGQTRQQETNTTSLVCDNKDFHNPYIPALKPTHFQKKSPKTTMFLVMSQISACAFLDAPGNFLRVL